MIIMRLRRLGIVWSIGCMALIPAISKAMSEVKKIEATITNEEGIRNHGSYNHSVLLKNLFKADFQKKLEDTVADKDGDKIKQLLESDECINAVVCHTYMEADPKGRSALATTAYRKWAIISPVGVAAAFGSLSLVQKLVEQGSPVDVNAVYQAVAKGHAECVHFLMQQDKNVIYEKHFYQGVPLLHTLYMRLQAKELKILVDGGADIYRKIPMWCHSWYAKPENKLTPPAEVSIYDLSLLNPLFSFWDDWNIIVHVVPHAYAVRDDLKEMAAFIASVVKSKESHD